MHRSNTYWAILLVIFSLSVWGQFDAVTNTYKIDEISFISKIPTYQLPLQSLQSLQSKQQMHQMRGAGSVSVSGRKSSHDAEELSFQERVELGIQKQMVTKKRNQANRLLILAHQVLHNSDWCHECAVIIKNGYIDSVKPAGQVQYRSGDEVHVYPTATLSPGFIDTLIHGADGHDVMHGTVEGIHGIASRLVEEGTTAFLPSTMTASPEAMLQAARAIHQSMQSQTYNQAQILGWHAEGPYFSAEKIGCHDPLCQRDPSIDEVIRWQKASGFSLRVITVAPELPGALAFIMWASTNGIVVSIGHTMADCDQTDAAIEHGATMATHLYNAMNNGSHKEAGCSTSIKTHINGIYYTLIVDGIHINHRNILELSGLFDFASRAVLITDGIMAKYKKDGTYVFGGQEIVVNGKEARLREKGNLAGSILKMNEAVANILQFAPHISLAEALLMASYNPAKAINAFGKGLVSEGYDADITLLDRQLNVLATYRAGKMAYQLPGQADFYKFMVE